MCCIGEFKVFKYKTRKPSQIKPRTTKPNSMSAHKILFDAIPSDSIYDLPAKVHIILSMPADYVKYKLQMEQIELLAKESPAEYVKYKLYMGKMELLVKETKTMTDKYNADYKAVNDMRGEWDAECKARYDNWGKVYNAEEVKWDLEYNAEHVKWEVKHNAKVDLLVKEQRELEMKNLYRPKELDLDYQQTSLLLEYEKQSGIAIRGINLYETVWDKQKFIISEARRKLARK